MQASLARPLQMCAAVATLFLATACRDQPETRSAGIENPPDFVTVFRPVDSIRLDAPAESLIGWIRWVQPIGDAIVVGDGASNDLKVFGWSGRLIRILGRVGSGPGEYHGPAAAAVLSDGGLAVADDGNARVTFYDSTLTRIGEFSYPGVLSGVTDAAGGRVAALALRITDGERTTYDAVHLFDRSGKLIRSGCPAPMPSRPMEGNVQGYSGAYVGSVVVWVSMVENVVHSCDPATGVQRLFTVGDAIYVPPQFPERAFPTPDQGRPWLGRQMWVNRLTGLDSDRYIVRFAVFGSAGTPTHRYVLADRAGRTLAVTGPTNLWIEFSRNGAVYATRRLDSGEVWLLRLAPPAAR